MFRYLLGLILITFRFLLISSPHLDKPYNLPKISLKLLPVFHKYPLRGHDQILFRLIHQMLFEYTKGIIDGNPKGNSAKNR